jgi:predicted HTH transcriptional regulator
MVVTRSYFTSNSSITKIVDNSSFKFRSKSLTTNSTPTMNMRINDNTFDNKTISLFSVVVSPDRSFNRFYWEIRIIITPTSGLKPEIITTISTTFGILTTTLGESKLRTSTIGIKL